MRDPGQDMIDMARRRERLHDTGFRLFAEYTIEAVSLQQIAKESGVGIATLYRHFGNKPELVIEIGTKKWQEYFLEVESACEKRGGDAMNAATELEFFLDCFIDLYRDHKDILRINRNFDTYVKHECCTQEQMRPYNEAVTIFADKFHRLYSKAREDHTLNIRISEKTMFVNLMYIMLSVAGKYAEGLVYPPDEERDMTEELEMLKQMIWDTYAGK